MPKVGDKEFPYTPEGIQKAAKESSKSGIPVSDAGNRAESYQLGGLIPGQPGFGKRPMVNRPISPVNPMVNQPVSPVNPIVGGNEPLKNYGVKQGMSDGWEKGGKVKKSKKRKGYTKGLMDFPKAPKLIMSTKRSIGTRTSSRVTRKGYLEKPILKQYNKK